MRLDIYYDKNTKGYFIKSLDKGVEHTFYKDKNGKSFKRKEDCYFYIDHNYDSLLQANFEEAKYKKTFSIIESEFKAELYKKLKMSGAKTSYEKYRKYVYPYLNKNLRNNTNETIIKINEIINNLKLSKKTKRGILVVAKKYFIFLERKIHKKFDIDLFYLNKNDFDEDKAYNYLTTEEFAKFDNALTSKRNQLLFELMFVYGLRVGEVRGLKNKDFDLSNNILYIRRAINSKNDIHTSIVVSPKTSSSIREYPLLKEIKKKYLKVGFFISNPESFVFSRVNDKEASENPSYILGETQIRRIKNDALAKAKIPHFRIHDLRHSCAINLVQNGFDISRVASWLGHKNPAITARYYLRYQDKNKKEIADFFSSKKVVHKLE